MTPLTTPSPRRLPIVGRGEALSAQIVGQVRDDLFERRLSPGDFVGTEKDLAARYGVSRIVARDALRTLSALGIVEIRMGKGGGARIAPGNPRLFAEALAVQLELMGVSAGEVLDAQRAIECFAAEEAARNATPSDLARLESLMAQSESTIHDHDAYTRVCAEFHLAIVEASHNRALVVQFLSLHHVSWPARNHTLTPKVARRVLDVHRELVDLIAARDAAGARRLMDEHVKMIRDRRVAERDRRSCC